MVKWQAREMGQVQNVLIQPGEVFVSGRDCSHWADRVEPAEAAPVAVVQKKAVRKVEVSKSTRPASTARTARARAEKG